MPITTSVLNFVSGASPLLGAVLRTPAANVAVKMLCEVFGVNDASALDSVIKGDPQANHRIVALQIQHADLLAKLASTDYAKQVEDRMDARDHAGAYGMFTKHMAYLVTMIFVLALVLVFLPIPLDGMDRDLLSMLIGMLASKWQTIIDFYFGGALPPQKPYTGSEQNGKG